jgi:hypothetical protein
MLPGDGGDGFERAQSVAKAVHRDITPNTIDAVN